MYLNLIIVFQFPNILIFLLFNNNNSYHHDSILSHVGGLFTGNEKYPGLAGLKESGELMEMIKVPDVAKKELAVSSSL